MPGAHANYGKLTHKVCVPVAPKHLWIQTTSLMGEVPQVVVLGNKVPQSQIMIQGVLREERVLLHASHHIGHHLLRDSCREMEWKHTVHFGIQPFIECTKAVDHQTDVSLVPFVWPDVSMPYGTQNWHQVPSFSPFPLEKRIRCSGSLRVAKRIQKHMTELR